MRIDIGKNESGRALLSETSFRARAPEFQGEAPEFQGEAPEFQGEAPEFQGEAPECRSGTARARIRALLPPCVATAHSPTRSPKHCSRCSHTCTGERTMQAHK